MSPATVMGPVCGLVEFDPASNMKSGLRLAVRGCRLIASGGPVVSIPESAADLFDLFDLNHPGFSAADIPRHSVCQVSRCFAGHHVR